MIEAPQETAVPVDETAMDNMEDTGINIWIDKYSDVFSDFDTRPLVKRRLSNDFITETCKMVREDPAAQVELKFNILDDKQDSEVEALIISHLHTLFISKKKTEQDAIKRSFRKGYLLTSAGFLLILGLAYISSIAKGIFFLNSLPVLTEPLAWFMTWTGLDHIFKNLGGDSTNVDINQKMLDAKVTFFCMGQMMPEVDATTTTPTAVVEAPPVQKVARKVIPAGNNLRIA